MTLTFREGLFFINPTLLDTDGNPESSFDKFSKYFQMTKIRQNY